MEVLRFLEVSGGLRGLGFSGYVFGVMEVLRSFIITALMTLFIRCFYLFFSFFSSSFFYSSFFFWGGGAGSGVFRGFRV